LKFLTNSVHLTEDGARQQCSYSLYRVGQ